MIIENDHEHNPIDDAGVMKQTFSNLFYGWGYNFYRKENQLRADDLLIRSKVSELISMGVTCLTQKEQSYRRVALMAPTRENPTPNSTALANVRELQRARQALEALEVQVRNAAVPEMDRIHQRHENEKVTLEALMASDNQVVEASMRLLPALEAITDIECLAQSWEKVLKTTGLANAIASRHEILGSWV